jgi:VanZ family protein
MWLERWVPLLFWCAVILSLSSDALSWNETSRFLGPVLALIFHAPGPETLETANLVMRKMAHIAEYLVLGWLVVPALGGWRKETTIVVGALVFVSVCASLDECRQTLTLARTPAIMDVGLDCFGGLLGISLGRFRGVR